MNKYFVIKPLIEFFFNAEIHEECNRPNIVQTLKPLRRMGGGYMVRLIGGISISLGRSYA